MEYFEYPKYFCLATNIYGGLRQKSKINIKTWKLIKKHMLYFSYSLILIRQLKEMHVLIIQYIFSFFDIFDN